MEEQHPLGLRHGLVVLKPYDPRWARLFEQEERLIRTGLGPLAVDVQHVGSTSVPGLAAKPILDIAVGVHHLGDALRCKVPLERLGYEHAPWAGLDENVVFGKGRPRTHLVHVVEYAGEGWRAYIQFRDALRGSPELRREYEALKQDLAARYPEARSAYTEAKGAFIQTVLAR